LDKPKLEEKPLHSHNAMRGALFAVIAAMLWATMGLAVKMASAQLSALQIVWFSRWIGFLAFSPVLFFAIKQRGIKAFKPRRPWLLLLRAFGSLVASYCLYYALQYLSLTTAVLLSYTRPLFLPLIVLAVYRKRLEPVIWFGLAIGFVGVLLILEPGFDFTHPAMLVALASGLAGACMMLIMRRLAKAESSDSITFHYFWMSVVLSSIPVIFMWETPADLTIGWLVLLGILVALYQMCLSRAYRYLRATAIGAILYSTLIFSTIYDWVIWGSEPNLYTGLGIILVVGSSILTIVLARKPIVPS
jgi:drug/metabolite transporter (DMT)-like permease